MCLSGGNSLGNSDGKTSEYSWNIFVNSDCMSFGAYKICGMEPSGKLLA
jgi:hypothetical protein